MKGKSFAEKIDEAIDSKVYRSGKWFGYKDIADELRWDGGMVSKVCCYLVDSGLAYSERRAVGNSEWVYLQAKDLMGLRKPWRTISNEDLGITPTALGLL